MSGTLFDLVVLEPLGSVGTAIFVVYTEFRGFFRLPLKGSLRGIGRGSIMAEEYTLTFKGLRFCGFCAQRPYCIRLM